MGHRLFAVALLLAAQPAFAQASGETPDVDPAAPAEGFIEGELGRIEILPPPPQVGETVTLAEGWYRVESAPNDADEASGSFGIVARAPEPAAIAEEVATARHAALDEAPRGDQKRERRAEAQVREPCRAEQEAYVERLWALAGIDSIENPLALIEALPHEDSLSPWVRLNLFGLSTAGPVVSTDPVKPLGWDLELISRARALVSCVERAG